MSQLVPALDLTRPPPDDSPAGPVNYEAEQALLGALLYDNSALTNIEGLGAQHFAEPFHGRLFDAIAAKAAKGVLADPVLLSGQFDNDPAYRELGGLRYLADLVDRSPPAANAPDYAAVVVDAALRRNIIAVGRSMVEDAGRHVGDRDAHTILSETEQLMGEISRGAAPGDANLIDARSSVAASLLEMRAEAESGKPKGLMTGLRCFDRRLRGLRGGHVIVIGGRPSMGKTALARQGAKGAAERNPHHQFVFFSQEMARRELDERTLSELTYRAKGDDPAIPYQDMSGDKLSPLDFARLEDLVWQVPKNLIIDDTAKLSVESISRRIWALKRKGKIGAAFIDYLQIMERPEARGRNEASVLGDMTASLKRLARQTDCAIVLLSQISRGPESRDDKRPQLSDLRESGAIEQDANAVLFPFREVYYVERAEPKEGTVEHSKWEDEVEVLRRRMDVICAKNRGGAVGTDRQEYLAEFDVINDIREDRT